MYRVVFDGAFPTLNEYIASLNNNRYGGNDMKQTYTEMVRLQCLSATKFPTPVSLDFHWYVKDKRKDPDNIVFAKKFILDGMVKAGVFPNDTQAFIKGFTDKWYIDKNERVEVHVKAWEALQVMAEGSPSVRQE